MTNDSTLAAAAVCHPPFGGIGLRQGPSLVAIEQSAPCSRGHDGAAPSASGIPSRSAPMRHVVELARRIAMVDTPICDDTAGGQADAQRRLEFERKLIAIVSHDLRNPIGAIIMCVKILERTLPQGDERVKRTLGVLEASAQRANRMVADILDIAKTRIGGGIAITRANCNLAAAVSQVVTETRTAYPTREIDFTVDGAPYGLFDEDRVAQAVTNLLVNAITHGIPSEPVEVRVAAAGNEVRVDVRNRGRTIPPEVLAMLFHPFYSEPINASDLPVAPRSVGLGLFIVDNIVKGHRGRIEVTSADELTTFSLFLPRSPPLERVFMLPPSTSERRD